MIAFLLSFAAAGSGQPPRPAQPPAADFIVCPGDPRCAATPPPAYVPPPLPPVPAEPMRSEFVVYFDWNSTTLSPEAREALDDVIAHFQAAGVPIGVALAGHTDRDGPAAYNLALSERYARAVRDYLAAGGVPPSAITIQAFGEAQPLVATEDGIREPQNRRVEIRFTFGENR